MTQVNELLTQMEAFDGIFVATTNLMDSLDAASLRRFPWKIHFDWLKPGQRWGLFVQEFARLGGDLDEATGWKEHVLQLDHLAPGDIAAVVRQYELWDETPSAREFYRRLVAEMAAKADHDEAPEPVRQRRRSASQATSDSLSRWLAAQAPGLWTE